MIPLNNAQVSYPYGVKNNRYKKGYHTGIDLISTSTLVLAAVSGTVQEARFAPGKGADPDGWGNYVIVRTDDGLYDIIYAHLSTVVVSKMEKVNPMMLIGKMGNTGSSTGPHLHFEVRKVPWTMKNDIDPAIYLRGDEEMPEKSLKEKLASDDTYLTVRVRESKVEEAIKEINKLGYAAKRLDLA